MKGLRTVLAAALVTLVVGACSVDPPVTCEIVERDPPAPLTCDAAVSAARPQLAGIANVTDLRFQYDECAPNAPHCEFLFGTAGNVIATLGNGAEIAVFVSLADDGSLRTQGPVRFTGSQPTPPP